LQAGADVLEENAKAIDAGYKPQLALQDTYSRSHYDDLKNAGFNAEDLLLEGQNEVMLTVNMRLFDRGKMKKEARSAALSKNGAGGRTFP